MGKLNEIWVKRVGSVVGFFEPLWNMTEEGKEFYRNCDYVHSMSASVIKSRRQVRNDWLSSVSMTYGDPD